MAEERSGVVTFKGGPMTLVGPELSVGQTAPTVALTGKDMKPVTLPVKGEVSLVIAVPSVDTSVCSLESKKFSDEARTLPTGVGVYVVSADLPFALSRWAAAESVDNLTMLTDYRSMDMARSWGIYLKELALFARAVYVLDGDGKVVYREIVAEVASEPDYMAAISAATSAVDAA